MKPKFCPLCSNELLDISFYLKEFSRLECKDIHGKTVTIPVKGWGVECHVCGWGGEILPNEVEK